MSGIDTSFRIVSTLLCTKLYVAWFKSSLRSNFRLWSNYRCNFLELILIPHLFLFAHSCRTVRYSFSDSFHKYIRLPGWSRRYIRPSYPKVYIPGIIFGMCRGWSEFRRNHVFNVLQGEELWLSLELHRMLSKRGRRKNLKFEDLFPHTDTYSGERHNITEKYIARHWTATWLRIFP